MSNVFFGNTCITMAGRYTLVKILMDTLYTYTAFKTLAQAAYGQDAYGSQIYSQDGATTPVNPGNPGTPGQPGTNPGQPGTSVDPTAPNTGFLGMSQSAVVATSSGALLIAIAIAGITSVFVSRARRNKRTQEK